MPLSLRPNVADVLGTNRKNLRRAGRDVSRTVNEESLAVVGDLG